MSRRPSIATEADIRRCIRACTKAGLAVMRVVVRSDRVEIEAGDGSAKTSLEVRPDREVIL